MRANTLKELSDHLHKTRSSVLKREGDIATTDKGEEIELGFNTKGETYEKRNI